MPTWFKLVLAFFLVIVAAVVVIGFTLPEQWNVERTVTIEAPPRSVHAWVNDLARWQEWAPWSSETDETLTFSLGERTQGEGGSFSWAGDRVGQGTLTITRSDPERGVWYTISLPDGRETSTGALTYQPVNGRTQVTWTDQGRMGGFTGRYFVPMLERVLATQFGEGLARLQRQIEKPQG